MARSLMSVFTLGIALGISLIPDARANIGENYGFGSRTAALGGAAAAAEQDAYAAYSNPAGLSGPSERRLKIGFGLLDMVPDILPITNVVVENNYVSDKSPDRTGTVDTDYRATFGQVLGLSYILDPEWHRLAFGFTAFIPLEQLGYFDSGEVYAPEYFLLRSRTQRPQFDLGLSMELSPGLSLGFGLHMAYSLTANSSVFLQSDSTKPSSLRLGASLTPKLSPTLGLFFNPSPGLSLGSVIRFPVRSPAEVNLQSGVRLTTFLPALDVNFLGSSAIFYDPLSIETGLNWKVFDDTRLHLQLDYQAWSQYETPALQVADPSIGDCQGTPCTPGFTVSPSNNPTFAFRDIVIPRVGIEKTAGNLAFRAGYSYRPSVLQTLSVGAGNYLDPSRHEFSLGLGVAIAHFLHFEIPCTIDFHGSVQSMVTETITKLPGNEIGDVSGSKIGAPGYEAGGKIVGGGVSLSLAI